MQTVDSAKGPSTEDPVLGVIIGRLVEIFRPDRIYLFGSAARGDAGPDRDRKSTRLNSSHANISYAVFCLKKTKFCGLLPQRWHSFQTPDVHDSGGPLRELRRSPSNVRIAYNHRGLTHFGGIFFFYECGRPLQFPFFPTQPLRY